MPSLRAKFCRSFVRRCAGSRAVGVGVREPGTLEDFTNKLSYIRVMKSARVSSFSRMLAVLAAALIALSGCTASITTAEPTSTPSASSDWQQVALQEDSDEAWNRVLRQFPDAARPEAEFIEWSTQADTGGQDRLIHCLNETSQSPPEESEVAHYVCWVQYPVKPEYSTDDADPKP